MTTFPYNTRTSRVEGASITASFFSVAKDGIVELVEGYEFSSSSSQSSSSMSSSMSSMSSSSISSSSNSSSSSSSISSSSSSMSSISSSNSSSSSMSSVSSSSLSSSSISSQSSNGMFGLLTFSASTSDDGAYLYVNGINRALVNIFDPSTKSNISINRHDIIRVHNYDVQNGECWSAAGFTIYIDTIDGHRWQISGGSTYSYCGGHLFGGAISPPWNPIEYLQPSSALAEIAIQYDGTPVFIDNNRFLFSKSITLLY